MSCVGDIALIELTSDKYSAAGVFVSTSAAGQSPSLSARVVAAATPTPNNQVCTSGARSKLLCGWVVDQVDTTYMDIHTNERVQHVVRATKTGLCINGGDSGGPVYTVFPGLGVIAKGIISGGAGTGTAGDPCRVFFTDITRLDWLPSGAVRVQGNDTIGYFDPSTATFNLRDSNSTGVAEVSFVSGPANGVPLAGDWNGDGIETVGYYNPSDGTFHLKDNNGSGPATYAFALGPAGAGAIPVVGDWNADGKDTVGYFDPRDATYHLRNFNSSGGCNLCFAFGPGSGKPVVGDWNGDGVDTVGFYVPASATFTLTNSTTGASTLTSFTLGPVNMVPVAGDWNGDANDSVGYFNPSDRTFHLRDSLSAGGCTYCFAYTQPGSVPVIGDWNGM